MNKFSKRLKDLREEKGLSQSQLANELNGKITHEALHYWEKGLRIPSLTSCIILADYFGVTLDYLAGREN